MPKKKLTFEIGDNAIYEYNPGGTGYIGPSSRRPRSIEPVKIVDMKDRVYMIEFRNGVVKTIPKTCKWLKSAT